MMPNLAHIHLLLNHWPIIGTFIAVGLLLVSLLGKSDHVTQVTLALFSLLALAAIPGYMSGNLAQSILEIEERGVSRSLIQTHQGAALLAFVALQASGGLAWIGLCQARRAARPAPWTLFALLACALVTVGLVTVTGSTGGAIRHPEILSGEDATSAVGALGIRFFDFTQYIITGSSRWIWPVFEALHFLGLALLFSTTGLLNLRMLGWLKHMPAGPLNRFIPWGFAGLGLNIVTGMAFFVGMPYFYVFNADFHLKIVALVLGGATLVLYTTDAFRQCSRLQAGEDAPRFAKLLAASSLLLWTAVIVFGRYMPMFEDTLDPRF